MAFAVGDVTGDGRVDIVTANATSRTVTTLKQGSTGGVFSLVAGAWTPGGTPGLIALGDVDGDHVLDVIVTAETSCLVRIGKGSGTGTFAPLVSFAGLCSQTTLLAADFDGNGRADVALMGGPVGTVRLDGGATVSLGNAEGSGADTGRSVAMDVDGDGHLDIVTASSINGAVSILLGDGTGGFSGAKEYTVGTPAKGLAVADCDSDGKLDIVAGVTGAGGSISVLLQR